MKVNRALNAYIMALLVLCIPLSASAHGKNGTAVEWGFPHKPGIVLVLSGGGTRGLAHIGVFEALERENIPISAIVGTSMGAIMGGLYACGYSPAEMEEILSNANLMEIISDRANAALPDMGFNSPPSWEGDIISFQKTKKGPVRGNLSLLQTKDLYSFLSELTSRTAITDFDELPIPFAAVATDLETGDCVELRDGNLASALRASMSIPGIFAPWEIDNRLLMDGGLKANLPVAVAKRIFPGHPVVAVNLSPQDITRPREHINSIMDVAAQTLEILMVEQTRENAALADVLIAPDVKDFGMLDSTGYDEIIGRGAAAALAQMDKIRMALNKHLAESASLPAHQLRSIKETTLLVADVLFDGVPQNVADSLYNKYDKWIGKPLDMSEVSGAVKELSARKEFVSVEGRTKRLSKDKAAVIFSIKRSPKYHFGMSGYAGNISSARWLSLSAQISDILADGDIGGIEARAGTDWGAMLRYFTPLDSRNSQFGIVLAARRESGKPSGAASYDFERYSARAAWYKQLNGNVRVGLGYAFSQADTGGEQKYHGPYAHLNFNYLDDPLLPTKGFAFLSDIWWPTDADAVTHTRFQTHIPFRKAIPKWTLVLSGGLKTGDMTDPAYAAYLGSCEELYSLADHPAGGDQAMWLHLGLMGILTKTWWGGLNVELFANYGEVYRNWSRLDDFWETGLALTIPTNTIRGKLVLVYDKDEEFTIGYSVGIPVWWNGPIP